MGSEQACEGVVHRRGAQGRGVPVRGAAHGLFVEASVGCVWVRYLTLFGPACRPGPQRRRQAGRLGWRLGRALPVHAALHAVMRCCGVVLKAAAAAVAAAAPQESKFFLCGAVHRARAPGALSARLPGGQQVYKHYPLQQTACVGVHFTWCPFAPEWFVPVCVLCTARDVKQTNEYLPVGR